MRSIVPQEKKCFFCGNPNVEEHHVFFGSNRRMSDEFGCVVWLCTLHHTHPQVGVHWKDPEYHLIGEEHDHELKVLFQHAWEDTFGTRLDFIKYFGRSWIL